MATSLPTVLYSLQVLCRQSDHGIVISRPDLADLVASYLGAVSDADPQLTLTAVRQRLERWLRTHAGESRCVGYLHVQDVETQNMKSIEHFGLETVMDVLVFLVLQQLPRV